MIPIIMDGGNGLKSTTKWYLRRRMGLLAAVLILIAVFVAILTLPEALDLSLLLLFVQILATFAGAFGVFIGAKRNSRRFILGSLIFAGWVYFFFAMIVGPPVHRAIFSDFGSRVFPIFCLGSLLFALFASWFEHWKNLDSGRFKHPLFRVLVWFLACLLIAVPFTIGGMRDYNYRADTSPPEVISMKIVHKKYSENLGNNIWIEAPDTGLFFSIGGVPYDFYSSHDVGNWVNATVHKGALGYPWLERYSD